MDYQQNEHRQIENQLRESYEFNEKVLSAATVGISTYRSDGQCVSTNESMLHIVGATREQILSQDFRKIESWQKSGLQDEAEKVMTDGIGRKREVNVTSTFGRKIWINCRFQRFTSGGEHHLLLIVDDITKRKQAEIEVQKTNNNLEQRVRERTRELEQEIEDRRRAEEYLRKSEDRLKTLFDHAPDAYFMHDQNGILLDVNQAAEAFTSYEKKELVGKTFREIGLLSPGDLSEIDRTFEELRRGRLGQLKEMVFEAKDGTQLVVEIHHVPTSIMDQPVVLGIARDITDRKKNEELRGQFIESVMAAQEDERRRLSRELHDELGSSLTSLMISLQNLEHVETIEAAQEKIRKIQSIADKTIQDVELLAKGLHPMALEQLGFSSAVEQYIFDYSKVHSTEVDVHLGKISEELPDRMALALYRIIQEALNNIAKHSMAQSISVVLEKVESDIRLAIEDDGKGMEISTIERVDLHGIGLQGIRERVSLLGGTMNIESEPGVGTSLFVSVPIRS